MHRMIIAEKNDLAKAGNSVSILQRGLLCLLHTLLRFSFFPLSFFFFGKFNITCTLLQETTSFYEILLVTFYCSECE